MPDDDVTLGEVARQLRGLAGSVDRMGEKVETLTGKVTIDYVKIGHLEERVASLEEWKRWAVRLVVGAVALAVMAVVLPTR